MRTGSTSVMAWSSLNLAQVSIALDDPVSKYIGAFADAKVGVDLSDEAGKYPLKLEPLKRPITIRDLLRHPSGITYGFFGETVVQRLYADPKLYAGDFDPLARDGVTIFFTQVFRDGFFHADMHPGNVLVSVEPATFGRYISLDFGIIGTLTEYDKEYLAQNFTALESRL